MGGELDIIRLSVGLSVWCAAGIPRRCLGIIAVRVRIVAIGNGPIKMLGVSRRGIIRKRIVVVVGIHLLVLGELIGKVVMGSRVAVIGDVPTALSIVRIERVVLIRVGVIDVIVVVVSTIISVLDRLLGE